MQKKNNNVNVAKNTTKVICIDTLEIFSSISEAAEAYKCNKKGISNCCRGVVNKCGGKQWCYYEDYLKLNKDNDLAG